MSTHTCLSMAFNRFVHFFTFKNYSFIYLSVSTFQYWFSHDQILTYFSFNHFTMVSFQKHLWVSFRCDRFVEFYLVTQSFIWLMKYQVPCEEIFFCATLNISLLMSRLFKRGSLKFSTTTIHRNKARFTLKTSEPALCYLLFERRVFMLLATDNIKKASGQLF